MVCNSFPADELRTRSWNDDCTELDDGTDCADREPRTWLAVRACRVSERDPGQSDQPSPDRRMGQLLRRTDDGVAVNFAYFDEPG